MKFSLGLLYRIAFWVSLAGLTAIIFDFGFPHGGSSQTLLDEFYFIVLVIAVISTIFRYINNVHLFRRKAFIFDLLSIGFTFWIFYMYLFVGVPFEADQHLENPIWIKIAVILSFIREAAERKVNFRRKYNLLVLTIIKKIEVKNIFGKTRTETQVQGVASADSILEPDNILVLYGSNIDLQGFLKQKLRG